MTYDRDTVAQIFDNLGEVMFVLESDREYELHGGESGLGNVELKEEKMVGEGLRHSQDGATQWVKVWIPYDAIEHYYTHKEI